MNNNPLSMSDDEFSKLGEPGSTDFINNKAEPKDDTDAQADNNTDVQDTDTTGVDPNTNTGGNNVNVSGADANKATEPKDNTDTAKVKTDRKESGIDNALNYNPEASDKPKNFATIKTTKSDETSDNQPIDYKGFYDKVMTPLKANGKLLKLRSPEEIVSLIQKGVGYTKRMQDMAPYRKAVAMLEKAKLLDEDQLSFLIDVHNKNPEAIRKLLKDSNLDSLDLELDDNAKEYVPGNNKITDTELQLKENVRELLELPNGNKTLDTCNAWDQPSKDLLAQNPQILRLLHEQMNNGVYQQVADEVKRLVSLGQIPANVPFLQAYKFVGDDMVKNQRVTLPSPQVKSTANAFYRSKVKNSLNNTNKVKQASITRTNPTSAKVYKNPLAMTDEEFMQTFGRR